MRMLLGLALACLFAAPAQAAYFGKNKVQYRSFRWQVLETPHFEILFYDREAAVVEDAARLAERSYERLAALLDHPIERRIPLILYASHSDFQQTNITESFIDVGTGGVTELLRRRVFLPFTGSWGELEHVLTHELVHAFELDILYDPDATDPLNPFAYAPPLWVMEGLAEFLSLGASDPHTDMWVRDACLAGDLPSLDELSHARDIRVYRLGESAWQFFAAEHGTDKIGPLLVAMRDQKSLDRAFRKVTGKPLADFSENWTTAMRRRFLPAIATHALPRECAVPVVTRKGEKASLLLAASVAPDGERIAYVADSRLHHDLYLKATDGEGKARRLVEGETSHDFEALRFFNAGVAWSPDGETIAFAAKSRGEDALYLLDVATGRIERRLAFGLDEVQTATWSPDGEELVFVGLAAGMSDLYRVHRDGSDLRRLTHDRYAERDPQWSPDGRRIAYVTDEGGSTDFDALCFDRMHLALLDLETGARCDATPFGRGKAVSPAWSGDGEYLAFVSDRDGAANIYVLHLPTGQVFRLTDLATGVSGILPTSPALSWARSSRRLVFTAFGKAGWDIYRIDDPLRQLQPLELDPGEFVPVSEDASLAENSTAAGGGGGGQFRIRDYKVRLSPDLANVGGVVGYESGFGGQSQIHFSDLLGNHHLGVGVGIYGSLRDSDLYVSYMNRSHRTNWSLAAFQFRKRYGVLGSLRSADIEHQTYRGVRATAIRPFSKFTRLEGSLQMAGVEGRFFLGETAAEADTTSGIETLRSFVGPGVAWVMDSAVYGLTGPIGGRRFRLGLEGAVGEIRYATLEADLRQYWNVRKWYAFAARCYAVTSLGSTPQTAYLGGAQSLRGYDYGALVGNHALLASAEFRFPLVRHLALGWPLPLEMGPVQGVLFADAGTAWDDRAFETSRAVRGELPGKRPQAALGFGMRFNLGYLVLKLDWAQRYDTGTGERRPGSSVALGTDF